MAKWTCVERGVTRGCCSSYHEMADLRLRQFSFRRQWRDLGAPADTRVDHRVTCSGCGRTYPVRADWQAGDAERSGHGPISTAVVTTSGEAELRRHHRRAG